MVESPEFAFPRGLFTQDKSVAMPHVSVLVIAPVLTNFFHCLGCEQVFARAGIGQQVHQEELEQYPEDIRNLSIRLTEWLLDLTASYGDQIRIRVIDPQSPEGFLKAVRYWVRQYPTFIVNGREKIIGWDREALDAALHKQTVSG